MVAPRILASIGDLELVARVTVDGAISGLHRSPFHGYSAEFSQYRHYRPGDDLKYVDWKLFARTDRFYTKQYRETTNMLAQIALDGSASMAFPTNSSRRPVPSDESCFSSISFGTSRGTRSRSASGAA